MKKTIVYIALLWFCLLLSNRSEAIAANIPFATQFATENTKFEANIDVKAPFQLVIDNAKEEQEDLFCDDEFDYDDDECHKKTITSNTYKFVGKTIIAQQTLQLNHFSTRNVKIFILFCSLKLHC